MEKIFKYRTIFEYMLKKGCIWENNNKYNFCIVDKDKLLLIKNERRCEISIYNFYKLCVNIDSAYYKTIIEDFYLIPNNMYLIKHDFYIKSIFNKIHLRIIKSKTVPFKINLIYNTVNDMFNTYINIDLSKQKKVTKMFYNILKKEKDDIKNEKI